MVLETGLRHDRTRRRRVCDDAREAEAAFERTRRAITAERRVDAAVARRRMRPAADELHAVALARVAPRRGAHEFTVYVRDKVASSPRGSGVVTGPAVDLRVEHLGGELGE